MDPQTPAATSELALFAAAGPDVPGSGPSLDGDPGIIPGTGEADPAAGNRMPVSPGRGMKTPAGSAPDADDALSAGSRGLRGKDFRDAMRRAQTGRKTTRAAGKRPVAPTPEPAAGGAELTATAHCIRCGWTAGPGDPAEVDKLAERHTTKPPKHPTSTVAEVAP